MVNYMDGAIGNITARLQQRGMWENTLVVFSADNGGAIYRNGTAGGNNYPLKGGKASNWEGGIRVNAFVSGGLLPPHMKGRKLEGLVTLWDWYATFASIAGVHNYTDERAALAGLPALDSLDQSSYILGHSATSARDTLPVGAPSGWHDIWGGDKFGAQVNGMILDEGKDGLWKLMVGGESMAIWTGPKSPNTTHEWTENSSPEKLFHDCLPYCLWRIDQDPTEHYDVASDPANAERITKMLALAAAANKTTFSPDRGTTDKLACTTAKGKWDNFWGPFLD